ncbi:hypothetical protein H5397_16345 [Propioniciclava sp. MC1683]|uniref:hypothetical protein n=1 Tax=Propioniciclava sp. MC1683 TaxID=2760309 RepID=UPI001603457B|nr:hypothetical protein [Propioniciclava sp. MC1683]MBB1502968.1 hypothetical protein [Propioniciclava sp. MC1683]
MGDDYMSRWQAHKANENANNGQQLEDAVRLERLVQELSSHLLREIPRALKHSGIPASSFPRRVGMLGLQTPSPGWRVGYFRNTLGPDVIHWLTSDERFLSITLATSPKSETMDVLQLPRVLLGSDVQYLFHDEAKGYYTSWIRHGDLTVPQKSWLADYMLQMLKDAERFARN